MERKVASKVRNPQAGKNKQVVGKGKTKHLSAKNSLLTKNQNKTLTRRAPQVGESSKQNLREEVVQENGIAKESLVADNIMKSLEKKFLHV